MIVYIVSKKQKRKIALKKQRYFWSSEITRLDISLNELLVNEKSLETYKMLKEVYIVYYHLMNKDEQCFFLRRLVAFDEKYSSQEQADNSFKKYKKFCDKNRKGNNEHNRI